MRRYYCKTDRLLHSKNWRRWVKGTSRGAVLASITYSGLFQNAINEPSSREKRFSRIWFRNAKQIELITTLWEVTDSSVWRCQRSAGVRVVENLRETQKPYYCFPIFWPQAKGSHQEEWFCCWFRKDENSSIKGRQWPNFQSLGKDLNWVLDICTVLQNCGRDKQSRDWSLQTLRDRWIYER